MQPKMELSSAAGSGEQKGATSKCILIAEDNPADVYLIREALMTRQGVDVDLTVVADGEQALDYLYRRGQFQDASRPDLIVLDLNLPKADGTEVLKSIRDQGEFESIPIIILTSSDSPSDKQAIESLGADNFLTKPSDLDSFLALGGVLLSYAERHKRSAV